MQYDVCAQGRGLVCFNYSVESSVETDVAVDVETEEVHSLSMV